jgi:uncharacterized protein YbaP (TraB family)
MKNKSIAFLLILFLNSHSSAQLLWKVSGNALEKPSYLFGTHHLISKERIPDFDKMLDVVKEVDVVVGEMDLSNMLELQLKLMKGATMKDSTLNELLSVDDYILVDEGFKEVLGMGVKKFAKYKPMMLSSLYTTMLYLKQQNLKKEPEAIDMIIQKFGKKNKKPIVGLETIEQQIDILFNKISLKRQAEMLVSTIKEKDKSTEMLSKLNEFYVLGDLIHLEALNNEDDEMNQEEKKILLETRNNNWLEQFKIMFPKNSCFVAVGCLHLTGEGGLLKQLSAKGFVIEPVTF